MWQSKLHCPSPSALQKMPNFCGHLHKSISTALVCIFLQRQKENLEMSIFHCYRKKIDLIKDIVPLG